MGNWLLLRICVLVCAITFASMAQASRKKLDPHSEELIQTCEHHLIAPPTPINLVEHFASLQELPNALLTRNEMRPHFSKLKETTRTILMQRGAVVKVAGRNRIDIRGNPQNPNISEFEQMALDLENENTKVVFNPRALLIETASAQFQRSYYHYNRLYAGVEAVAFGIVDDYTVHELCHKDNVRRWQTGRKSAYNLKFYANRDNNVSDVASYSKVLFMEELDCYSAQIEYLNSLCLKLKRSDNSGDHHQLYRLRERIRFLSFTAQRLTEAMSVWTSETLAHLEKNLRSGSMEAIHFDPDDPSEPSVIAELEQVSTHIILPEVRETRGPEILTLARRSLSEALSLIDEHYRFFIRVRAITGDHRNNSNLPPRPQRQPPD